jgi:hypothetical protein
MTRTSFAAAALAVGLVAAGVVPAVAQTPSSPPAVIVPGPSASPPTVVAPAPGGTTVVTPPGSTVIVQPPAATTTAAVVPVRPWCGGEYATGGGTNFGACGIFAPR